MPSSPISRNIKVDDFPEDWTPICRREEECCEKTKNHQSSKWINDGKSVDLKWEKTKKEDCYFCN